MSHHPTPKDTPNTHQRGTSGGENIRVFQWLVHGQPIPDGWKLADQRMDTHHNDHAVLIEQVDL